MKKAKKEPVLSTGLCVFIIAVLCIAGLIGILTVIDGMAANVPAVIIPDPSVPAADESGRAPNAGNTANNANVASSSVPIPTPANNQAPNDTASSKGTDCPAPTQPPTDIPPTEPPPAESTPPPQQEATPPPSTGHHAAQPIDTTNFTLLTTVDNSQLPWYLKLVNRYNFLSYCFMPNLTSLGNGHYFDSRAAESLNRMLASARAYGLSPIVASSFRSVSRQTTLFNNQVQRQRNAGLNEADAFEAARRVVAYPGTSEHNLGLAVDIVALSYQHLTAAQGQTPEGIWLAQNSHRYGFVLRYPYYKQHITNIIYEPWHFRYVGVAAATFMFENDLVLEEYVSIRLGR